MKKLSIILSLYCCLFLTEHMNAANNTNNNSTKQPQAYFLSEPNQTTTPQTQSNSPTPVNVSNTQEPVNTTQPSLRINSSAQPYNNTNFQVPGYTAPTNQTPSYNSPSNTTAPGSYAPYSTTPAYTTPITNSYATQPGYNTSATNSYGTQPGYQQTNAQTRSLGQTGIAAQNANTQPSGWSAYPGYRYTGQSVEASDSDCCEQPEDQACGDNYSLYCHYRPSLKSTLS